MRVEGWEQRYRAEPEYAEDSVPRPTPLVQRFLGDVRPGTALDLAAGTGRNSLWLAQKGWDVTAVEGSSTAVEILQRRGAKAGTSFRTVVADLQKSEFAIEPAAWDAITICYYLQRDLIEPAKAGLRPGGTLIVIVHTTEGDEQPTGTRMSPGELRTYFNEWEILHYYEGKPDDPEHRRSVAEVVVQRSVLAPVLNR